MQNMISKEDIKKRVMEQLSWEFNCMPEDFLKEDNTVTASIVHEKRRVFSEKAFFLQMATFGGNAVISANEAIHPWLKEWVKDKKGFWLFEQHNFYELECELRKYGYKMALTHHMFLPDMKITDIETDIKTRWLEQKDIKPFYGKEEFSNALCSRFIPERPDVLAVVALDGEKIMGMAGCSADTPSLWQIGVDVLPGYRGRGIGKALVSLLRGEAFRRGALPYSGTGLSNIPSWRVALASGFLPAWVEAEARETEDGSFGK